LSERDTNAYSRLHSQSNIFMALRICLLILTLLFIRPAANAQLKPFSFGVYGEAMFRTPAYKENSNFGYGGGLDFQFKLPVKLGITGSAGLLHFDGIKSESPLISTPELNIGILRAGLKYRINLLYLKLESGAAMPLKTGETTAILSPGLGVRFAAIDLQGKYEIWLDDANQEFYGIKLGIFF
jgi:hypothetical protein